MLNYVITVAISVIFVPHYLSIFWEPLRTTPWDVIVGIAVTWLLVGLNIVGIKEAASLNVLLAVLDFATQLLLVGSVRARLLAAHHHEQHPLGYRADVVELRARDPGRDDRVHRDRDGLEPRGGGADPLRSVPRAISWVAIAVFAIYFTLPWVALSAMPVHLVGGEYVTQLGQDPPPASRTTRYSGSSRTSASTVSS
jgi:Amino acid transporters